MYKKLVSGVCVILLSVSTLWAAEESPVDLDKIVVTPSRYSQQISEASSSMTIISRDDIENSGAVNTVDILRSVPGIVVRDIYGNGAKASVDMRGFGDMDAMNTLVMIDGRRVNEVDLSGVDWSQIPLDQIQKIEIIRGGNSVLYGDNAVGGVINIITKKGKGKPTLEIGTELGSYDRNLEKMSFSGSKDRFSYFFGANRQGTHGYRKNSFFKAYDYGSKLEYEFTDSFSAHFNSGFHRASYGLPGALSGDDITNFGRSYSRNGDDRATDKDYYFMAGAKNRVSDIGELSADLSYRIKDVNSNLIGGNGGWDPLRMTHIKTLGLTPKMVVDRTVLEKNNNLITGVDFYRSFFTQDNLSASNSVSNITHINKYSLAGYLEDEFFVLKDLSLKGGFRYEAVKYIFGYHDNGTFFPNPDVDTKTTPNKKAYNFGINYQYGSGSNVFFNLNQSYRFPAVDEFFTGTLNTSLRPQVSHDLEAGVRHNFGENVNLEFSVYRMKIKDELFTDPTASSGLGATTNYDETIHKGIDLSANIKLSEMLSLYGGYSYQNAEFHKGSFGGSRIPWVPQHKANAGLRAIFLKDFTLNLGGYYIGSRYRINDVNNNLPKIKNYLVTNLGLSYGHGDLTVNGSINNLFNQHYYEFATYGAYSGNKLYYTAPGRNFTLKFNYKF